MGKIWDWHKKVFNNPIPVIAYTKVTDDYGNSKTELKTPLGSFIELRLPKDSSRPKLRLNPKDGKLYPEIGNSKCELIE